MTAINIKLFKNKMILTSTVNNKKVEVYPDEPFSNSRLIISNEENAVKCIVKTIKEHKLAGSFVKSFFIFEIKELLHDDFSQVEYKTILNVGFHAGARDVFLYDNNSDLDISCVNKDFLQTIEEQNKKYHEK